MKSFGSWGALSVQCTFRNIQTFVPFVPYNHFFHLLREVVERNTLNEHLITPFYTLENKRCIVILKVCCLFSLFFSILYTCTPKKWKIKYIYNKILKYEKFWFWGCIERTVYLSKHIVKYLIHLLYIHIHF